MPKQQYSYEDFKKDVILKSAGEISKEDEAVLDKYMGENQDLSVAVMRQADYSRGLNEAQTAQEAARVAAQDAAVIVEQNRAWKAEAVKKIEAAEAAQAEIAAQAEAYKAQLAKAKESGFEIDGDVRPAPPAASAPVPKVDLGNYVTREDGKRIINESVGAMSDYHLAWEIVRAQHVREFGNLDTWDPAALEEASRKTGEPIDRVWAKHYDVADHRVKAATADLEGKLAMARAEGAKEGEAKAVERLTVMPDSRDGSNGSPVHALSARLVKERMEKEGITAADGRQPFESAAEAFLAHRHAQPGSPHWKPPAGNAAGS